MPAIQVIGDPNKNQGNRRYIMDNWTFEDDENGIVYDLGKPTIDRQEDVPCMVCVTLSNQYGGEIMDEEIAEEMRNINESHDHSLHERCIVRKNIQNSYQISLEDVE